MIALIDAALWLAKENGQDARELGRTMAKAFAKIGHGGAQAYDADLIEEIHVVPAPE